MKAIGLVAGLLSAAMLAGAAQGQTPACTQLKQILSSTHDQVKAMRGAVTETKKDETLYASKTQLAGFTDCSIATKTKTDSYNKYLEHHFSCSREAASSDAANAAIEEMYACTRDLFSERSATEAYLGGRYRIIGIDGDMVTKRDTGVSFGDTEFTRLWVEKSFRGSEEFDLHVYFHFLK